MKKSFLKNVYLYIFFSMKLYVIAGSSTRLAYAIWMIPTCSLFCCYNNFFFLIKCVRSCDQKPYLHNDTEGGICIKIEFNPQKNISLLQDGRCFFVYSSNMAAVTPYEHTLFLSYTVLYFGTYANLI